ncbi:hypothetical protein BRAO285_1390001 [Bradyrhizobium sp. ORS 285]|nr:hypothetical protein BRAO285_1390001 [Bradyrhizobium sp. ORS 285]
MTSAEGHHLGEMLGLSEVHTPSIQRDCTEPATLVGSIGLIKCSVERRGGEAHATQQVGLNLMLEGLQLDSP